MVTHGINTEEYLEIFRGNYIGGLFYIFRTEIEREMPLPISNMLKHIPCRDLSHEKDRQGVPQQLFFHLASAGEARRLSR